MQIGPRAIPLAKIGRKERKKNSERFICAYRLRTLYSLTNLL